MESMTLVITVAILLDCVRVLVWSAAVGIPLYAITTRLIKAACEGK